QSNCNSYDPFSGACIGYDPECAGTWGPLDVYSAPSGGTSIAPGQSTTFELGAMTAPATAGTYNEQWQIEDTASTWNGSTWVTNPFNFGGPITIPIIVGPAGPSIS